jgi:hypothetical protein
VERALGQDVMGHLTRDLNFLLDECDAVAAADAAADAADVGVTADVAVAVPVPVLTAPGDALPSPAGSSAGSAEEEGSPGPAPAPPQGQASRAPASPGRHGGRPQEGAVTFTSRVGPQHKNAFAAEVLEIITTATSFFNN